MAKNPFLTRPFCTFKRVLEAAAKNLSALLALVSLPRSLISANDHDVLLTHYRIGFISDRLGIISFFLGIATIAWIPVDIFLFDANWQVITPLSIGRLIAGLLFFAIGCLPLRHDNQHHGVAAVGTLVSIGIVFFYYAHSVIGSAHHVDLLGPGHAQYLLMPIVFAAGISIFPLTLIESVAVSSVALIAFLIESLHGDGGANWIEVGIASILMCAIMITTASCSVSQLKLLMDLYWQSTIDPLTQMLSRRAGMELLDISFAKSRRADTGFTIAMLDLDLFKSLNDCCGHEAGDRLLQELGQRLKKGLRRQDALIRWGGEEFLLILENTDAASAIQRVSDMCQHGLGIRADGSVQTVSIGLAEQTADRARDWQELVDIADKRLYAAKKLGRDRLNGPAAISHRLVGDERSPAVASPSTVPGYLEDYGLDGERDPKVFSVSR